MHAEITQVWIGATFLLTCISPSHSTHGLQGGDVLKNFEVGLSTAMLLCIDRTNTFHAHTYYGTFNKLLTN